MARPLKTFLLAPRQGTREILSPVDAARMLKSGSWVAVAEAKPISKQAMGQRRFRERCQEEGMRQLVIWLPSETFELLKSKKGPKESMAEVVERAVKMLSII